MPQSEKKLVRIKPMDRKTLLKKPLNRAQRCRMLAKLIDFLIVAVMSIMFYPMGLLIGVFYFCIADCLYVGQSIGKRFMGMAVVSLIDGSPCSFGQSFLRNLPFSIPLFFFIFPAWGWIFSGVFACPVAAMEVYYLVMGQSVHRLGDILADTTVIADDGTRLDLRKTKSQWFDTPPLVH